LLDEAMDDIRIEGMFTHFEATTVTENEGSVTAVFTWRMDKWQQVTSTFRLQPSLYGGWDVVQTSLLDDLLALL
jgi:hypothetical protein